MASKRKRRQDIERNGPIGPWTERIKYSDDGYAFRPREILIAGGPFKDAAVEAFGRLVDSPITEVRLSETEYQLIADADFDVESVVAQLRRLGFAVDPNHVLFSHAGQIGHGGCYHGCTCGAAYLAANPLFASSVGANPLFASSVGANPLFASSVGANPLFASSVGANPLFASPLFASPLFASPLFASPLFASSYQTSGERPSSARPASAPTEELPTIDLPENVTRAFILDTGLADDLPPFLDTGTYASTPSADRDAPDESEDGFLDPASGHGTFIAGILEQLAPNQDVRVARVLSTFGDGDVAKVAARLDDLRTANLLNDRTVINLSFGGYTDADMPTLAIAIRLVQATGAVVVASAGNDGVCRPTFPACLPGVVSVGSIEATGRAYYSNHGPWVRACAPGTDLTSAFFRDYDGAVPAIPDTDPEINPDHYLEWAQWTGTSFAAPVVTAALMRHMARTGSTAEDAVTYLIDSPGLLRYPGLGTVVNLAPGM